MTLIKGMHFIALLLLITICWFDIKEKRIPDILVIVLLVCCFSTDIITDKSISITNLIFAFITTVVLCGIYMFLPLGFGDVKLLATLSYALGALHFSYCLFISCVSAGIYVLIVNIKSKRDNAVPFAPFITLGTIFSYFAGKVII